MSSVPQAAQGADSNAIRAKRESISTPFLESFQGLANVNQADRVQALHTLLNHLKTVQSLAEESSAKLGTLPADVSLRICCGDLTYAVNRLTKGLASSRAAARQGFALALTEVLRVFPNVPIKDVVEQLITTTSNINNPSKSEMRDMALGRVIGTLAIVRSGRLQSAPVSGSGRLAAKLMDAVLPILAKRPWIGSAGSEAVSSLLECITLKEWNAHVAAVLEPFLQDPVAGWTPEQVSITLALETHWLRWHNQTNFPYDPHSERELSVFGNAPDAVKRLRASLSSNAQTATQVATAGDAASGAGHLDTHPLTEAARHSTVGFPAVHPMWTGLFQRYADTLFAPATTASALTDEQVRLCLREFALLWEGLVESNLLQATGDARRATALILLSIAIGPAAASASVHDLVPLLLSPRLLRAVLTPLPNRENILHGPARTAYSCLIHAVKTCPAALSPVLFTVLARGAAVASVNEKHVLSNLVTTLLAELTRRPKAEAVAVLKEQIYNMLKQFLVVESVSSSADGSKSDADSDEDSSDSGNESDEDTGAFGEEGDALTQSTSSDLPPDDAIRLQTFEALVNSFTAPVLADLRDDTLLLPFLRFCAFHAHATLSEQALQLLAEASSSSNTPQSTPNKSKKSPKKTAASQAPPALVTLLKAVDLASLLPPATNAKSNDNLRVAELLVANPPISQALRKQLTARIATLTHTVAEMKASAAMGSENAASEGDKAPAAGQQKKKAKSKAGNANADKEGTLPRGKNTSSDAVDRHVVLNRTLVSLAETVSQVYDAALEAKVDAEEADLGSLVTVSPSLEQLNTVHEDGEEEEESDSDHDHGSESEAESDDEDEESDSLTPFDARNMAKGAVTHLRSLADVLASIQAANPSAVPSVVFHEAMRQITMYNCFLSEVSLFLLSEVNETPARAQDAAVALGDLVAVMAEMLSPVFAFARTLVSLPATSAATTPSSTPSKKNKNKDKKSADAAAVVDSATASEVKRLISEIRALSAAAKGETDFDEEADMEAQHEEEAHADLERATSVFIDSLLSLLANANASLRNIVKSVLRNCLSVHTPDALQPVFDLIVSTVTLFSTLDKEAKAADEDSMDVDSDSDSSDDEEEGQTSAPAGKSVSATEKAVSSDSESDASSDEDVDSDAETEEEDPFQDEEDEDAESSAPLDRKKMMAEMERYDRVFEQMLRLRRESKGSTKQAKVRAVHFRYRAIDILEVATNKCLSGSTKLHQYNRFGSVTDTPVVYAHPSIFALLEHALRTARKIAIKSRANSAPGSKSSDADLVGLLNKLCGVLQKTASRSKVPSLADPSALPREYTSAKLTMDAPAALLRSAVQFARSCALPVVADTCNAVTNLALRAMRAPGAVAHIPQPALAALDSGVVDLCKETLEHLLTAKRPRIGYQFFRTIFASLPTVSVHLLPVFADAIANHNIPRPFRIGAAYEQIHIVLKGAAANWAKDLPCGGSSKDVLSVSQALRQAIPSLIEALSVSLKACIEDAKSNANKKKEDRKEVLGALAPNAQKDHVVPLLRFLSKAKLLTANELSDKFTSLLAEYASVTPIKTVKKSAAALCKELGISVDEEGESMDVDEEDTPKKAEASTKKKSKSSKPGKTGKSGN